MIPCRSRSVSAPPLLEHWVSDATKLVEVQYGLEADLPSGYVRPRSLSLPATFDHELHSSGETSAPQLRSAPPLELSPALSAASKPSPSLCTTPSPSPSIACTAPSPPNSPPPPLTRTTSAQGYHSEAWTTPPDRDGARSAPPDLAPLQWDFGNPWIITDYDYALVAGDSPPLDDPRPSPTLLSPPPLPAAVLDDERDHSVPAITSAAAVAITLPSGSTSTGPTSKKLDRKGKRERERGQRRAMEEMQERKAARRKEKRQRKQAKKAKEAPSELSKDIGVEDVANGHAVSEAEVATATTPPQLDTVYAQVDSSPEPMNILDHEPRSLDTPKSGSSGWLSEDAIEAVKWRLMGSKSKHESAAPAPQRVVPPLLRLTSPIRAQAKGDPCTSAGIDSHDTTNADAIVNNALPSAGLRTSTCRIPPASSSALALDLHPRTTLSGNMPADAPGSHSIASPARTQTPNTEAIDSDELCSPSTVLPCTSKPSKPKKKKSKKKATSQVIELDSSTIVTETSDSFPDWTATLTDPAIAVMLPDPTTSDQQRSFQTLQSIHQVQFRGRVSNLTASTNGLLPEFEFIAPTCHDSISAVTDIPELCSIQSLSSSPHSSEAETPPPASPTVSPMATPKAKAIVQRVRSIFNSPTVSHSSSCSLVTVSSPPSHARHTYTCQQPDYPQWLFSWAVLNRLRHLRERVKRIHICPSPTMENLRIRVQAQNELLRHKWEDLVDDLRADMSGTGSCQSLDIHWEKLLVTLWETETKLAAAMGRPTPSWKLVAIGLWTDDKFALAHELAVMF